MKVKIIATGEIKEVLKWQSYPLEYIDKEGNIYTCGEAARIEEGEIDWERRRYEIAKDALCAYLSVDDSIFRSTDYEAISKQSICFADELIKQLKGE